MEKAESGDGGCDKADMGDFIEEEREGFCGQRYRGVVKSQGEWRVARS